MNEILQHYVPQNDIGQEPVIPSKAISTFGVERLPHHFVPRNDKEWKASALTTVISSEPCNGDREIPMMLLSSALSLE